MRRSHLLPRLVLATILTIGIAPIWIMATTLIFEYLVQSKPSAGSLWIRPDGTPLLYYYSPGGNTIEYQDLAGRPVEVPLGEESLQFVALLESDDVPGSRGAADWQQRIRSFTDTRNQPTFWYLISDGRPHGSTYFVGYNAANNRRVGYLGLRGFRTEPLPAEECFAFSGGLLNMHYRIASRQAFYSSGQFPPTYLPQTFTADRDFEAWKVYLLTDDKQMHRVDLKERTVEPILTMPDVHSCQLYTKSNEHPTLLAACTDRELLLLDGNHQVKRRYAISKAFATEGAHKPEGAFHWAEIEAGKSVAYWTESPGLPASDRIERIVWFDEAGQVSRREAISRSQQSPSNLMMATIVPIPLLDFVGAAWLYPWELLDNGTAESWPQAIAMAIAEFWPMLLVVSLFSTLLSAGCYFRLVQSAASPTERIVWPVFVWLGGWPAWLAFRFAQRWPVLQSCPHCGRTVPRDRISCAKCDREFARPAPQGIEILAS